jgi:predicted ribosome quality control (RQC) complex YloA/Tae2 family protein
MIQYYLDLEMQVKKISSFGLEYAHIQKIYSTAYFIALSVRSPGKTRFLYLGRGNGFEGVWLGDSPPPSSLRRKDNFLEYFRKHLSSCSFLDLELDTADRIIKLTYQKYGKMQSLLLFWKARKLYFLHHFQESPETGFKVLMSWKSKPLPYEEDSSDLFALFDEVGRNPAMARERKSEVIPEISDILAAELKLAESQGVSSKPGFLKRKKENIEEDLRKALQWHKLQALLDRNDNIDSVYELKVDDQKIKFEGELNPYERRDLVFQKIKKLKRGEKILSERLSDISSKITDKPDREELTSKIPIHKPVWGVEKIEASSKPTTQEDSFKVFDFEGYSVGVGLNAQGNDQLRSRWATKEDFWLHLDGERSSHAIIKLKNIPTVTGDMLNYAATILAHFSHLQQDWIPIIYTQVKNLKGVTGLAGKVIYKKEKHLQCQKVKIDSLQD